MLKLAVTCIMIHSVMYLVDEVLLDNHGKFVAIFFPVLSLDDFSYA